MKKIIAAALLSFSLNSFANNAPLWLRFCSISPDGQTIAFSYKGDLFSVPVNGGIAKQLTTNPAYDAQMDKKLLSLLHEKAVWIFI